jgi:PAS domain S-box-containing protein
VINAKILVVDDEIIVAQNIESWLKRFGYHVPALFSSAEQAIQHITQEKPDLVLMDIHLAGEMDGVEAAQQIRTRFDIPVVFLSAYADTETIQRALLTEPYGYVLKPFNIRQLRSTIEMALFRYEREKKVRDREKRFRTVAAFSYDWEYWLGPDGSLLYISPSCVRITGYSPEEFIANPTLLETIVHPEDQDTVSEHLHETHEEPYSFSMDFRIITRSGEEKWISHSCQAVYGNSGEWLGRRGSNRDITASKRAEREIIQQGKFFRTIIDTIPNLVYVRDANGCYIMVNHATADFFGVTPEEMVGRQISDFISNPQDAEQFQVGDQQVIAEQKAITSEVCYTSPDGRKCWFATTKVPLVQPDNTTYIFEVATDITEIKQTTDELARSEERFSKAFHVSPLPTFVSRLSDDTLVDINQGCLDLTGYSRQEMIGHTLVELGVLTPQDQKRLWKMLKKRGSVSDAEITIQTRYREKRDGLAWLELVEIGGETCLLGKFYDITGRKCTEEILAHTVAELGRSNKELEHFAYVASHDLQEPLRKITGFIDLLERQYKGQLDEKADEYIERIVDGADRMQRLITDLLDYSRVGQEEISLTPIDLEAVLGRVLSNLGTEIEENSAVITHDPLPTIQANESLVDRLLQNLIGNAIKFRREETPQVHISAEQKRGELRFSIRDNGIGIDSEDTGKIFMIFQRLHTREEYPGTGIGLAICKKIVERHGGRIWVESKPGQGSTFFFILPSA